MSEGEQHQDLGHAWRVLIVAGIAQMIPSINLSVMYVVYPEIQREFTGTSAGALSWILNGYTIVAAATLVLGGVLADRTGRKRTLMIGTALSLVSVLVCGSAPNATTLLVGRILLALAASALIPATTSLVLRAFPPAKSAMAFGVLASFGGVSAAAGPSLGAFIIDLGGWRWAFFANVPLALITLVLGPKVFTESRDERTRDIPDLVGAAMLMLGLTSTILAVVQSPAWGWGDRRTIGALVVGVLLLAAMVVRSLHHRAPFIDFRLFRYRNFAIMNATSCFFAVAWFGMFFVFTQFLRNAWDYELLKAGLLVSPVPFGAGVLAPIGGRVADRLGYRPMMIAGAVAYGLGALWYIFALSDTPSVASWMPGIVLIAVGTGLVFPSVQGGTVVGMPADRYAIASGVNHTVQRIGAVVGNAIAIMFVASVGPAGAFERMFWIVFGCSVLMVPVALAMTPGAQSSRSD
jgi:EmrB/QacA subfamily drug resistance transporter